MAQAITVTDIRKNFGAVEALKGVSPLQIRYLIERHVEYLGGCHAVDVLSLLICLDQLFIP